MDRLEKLSALERATIEASRDWKNPKDHQEVERLKGFLRSLRCVESDPSITLEQTHGAITRGKEHAKMRRVR